MSEPENTSSPDIGEPGIALQAGIFLMQFQNTEDKRLASGIVAREQLSGMGIHYHYYSLSYMLEAQKRAGYTSMELFCAAPHVHMTSEGIADKADLIRTIRESGQHVVCVTPDNCMGPWQYAARGAEVIEQCRRYFTHTLELAADLGCSLVACHSGWGLLDEPREEAWKRSVDFMSWYAQEAGKYGITLACESLRAAESNLVNSLDTLRQYLADIGAPNIRPMIDTCAMAVAGEKIADWFETFGNDIVHMHFVDGTPYGHLAWGDGNRSLEEYMSVIRENRYTGALTQELTDNRYYDDPMTADMQSMKVLRDYIRED